MATNPPSEGPTGSLAHRFFQRLRRNRAELLEEREWRRRIILASRKIQHVHTSLTEDISDVRGLKSHIEGARPEMERLEVSLQASRGIFEKLKVMLDDHSSALSAHVDVTRAAEEAEASKERVAQLERENDAKDETVRELRATVAGLREEVSNLLARPPLDPEATEQSARRIAELEEQLSALVDVRGDLERALNDLELVRTESAKRAARLENRLRLAEDERSRLVAEQEASLTEVRGELERACIERDAREAALSQAQTRVDTLEAQAQAAFLRENEQEQAKQELEAASREFETRIDELQAVVLEFQRTETETAEKGEQREAEYTARVLELEGCVSDLEAELQRRSDRLHDLEASEADASRSASDLVQRLTELQAEYGVLSQSLEEERIERAKREQELTELVTRADSLASRVEDAEALSEAHGRRREELQTTMSAVEERAEELQRLVDELRRSEQEAEERDRHYLARIKELEGSTAEFEVAQAAGAERATELEQARAAEADRARSLESELSGAVERHRVELERVQREKAAVEEAQAERILALEEGEREGVALRDKLETTVKDLEARLRKSEMQRLDVETRSQKEMTDFADHSLARQRELDAKLAAKDKELTVLKNENDYLEQRVANLTRKTEEFSNLKHEMRASSLDLEQQTSRLMDLMGRGETEQDGIEHDGPVDLPEEAELVEGGILEREDERAG